MILKFVQMTFFLGCLVAGFVQVGAAQTPTSVIIGVVDLQKIMRELDVVEDINAQVQALEEKAKSELATEEKNLKNERTQIERQKTLVTPEAYSKKQSEFNRKAADFRVKIQEKNRQVQLSRVNALDKIKAQMLPIIREVMDENGASLILDVSELLFVEKPLEITEEVMSRLNKDLTKIKVEIVPLKKS
jgi:Skp family chaperone for outer membrane proteins